MTSDWKERSEDHAETCTEKWRETTWGGGLTDRGVESEGPTYLSGVPEGTEKNGGEAICQDNE